MPVMLVVFVIPMTAMIAEPCVWTIVAVAGTIVIAEIDGCRFIVDDTWLVDHPRFIINTGCGAVVVAG